MNYFAGKSKPVSLTRRMSLQIFVLLLINLGLTQLGTADEIVVDYSKPGPISVGDFRCSSVSSSGFDFFSLHQNELTPRADCLEYSISAGELWTYLKSQGINSTDKLVLFFDVNYNARKTDLMLESLEFTIKNENGELQRMILDRDNDNRVLIKGSDLLKFRPEAKVEVGLGFDFMQRFSADSSEQIVLRSNIKGDYSESPQILVQGKRRIFSLPNLIGFAGFVGFWGTLFWLLKKFTIPASPNTHPTIRPQDKTVHV